VVNLNEKVKGKKLELNYPCNWKYKIVVNSDKNIESVVEEVMGKRECKINSSKESKGGKYKSYNLEVLVHNDDDREVIYEELKKHNDVKAVL